MTLLITVFAAVAATALWYGSDSRHQMKWGTLCWLFWGASLMWLVDAINRAGSADPEAIRDALEQTDVFEGLIGTLVMDPATHNPSMACAVYECHGDSFEFKEIIEAQ